MDTAITTDDRFTAERYFQLVDEGAIGPDDRVELLDGVIVAVAPTGPRHASAITRAMRTLMLATVSSNVVVRVQVPIVVSAFSAPEPDVAVVTGTYDDYGEAHPKTALLAVEISDTSLAQDRITKARIYAGANIPEYWIVNLRDDCVEALSSPEPRTRTYRERRVARRGESLTIAALPTIAIAVADLLPVPDPNRE